MRNLLTLLALALALSAAGCTTPTEDGGASDDTTDPDAAASLPDDMEETGTVTAGADPTAGILNAPCETPGSECVRYPFTVESNATVDASLSWSTPAADLDLHLFRDGEAVAESTSPPPGTSESLTADLRAGEYELVVVAYSAAQETYTLTATFS